jgi:hypothetical protein
VDSQATSVDEVHRKARKGAVGQQLSPVESRYARSSIESRDVL